MDSFDKIEAMLAEVVEQANDQKKQSGEFGKKLDSVINKLSQLENKNEAVPPEPISMITLKDHEEKMKETVAGEVHWYKLYTEAKEQNEALLAERPYWATKVWPIKLCKWIYQRRHWWGLTVHVFYTVAIPVFIFVTFSQCSEISGLRETQMKYRFINAGGYAPQAVPFLEDAYEKKHKEKIEFIERTVSDYEKALKHTADSIARAERKKLERF